MKYHEHPTDHGSVNGNENSNEDGKSTDGTDGSGMSSEEDRSASEHYYIDFKDVHPGHYQYKFRVGQDEHQWVLDESADIGEST